MTHGTNASAHSIAARLADVELERSEAQDRLRLLEGLHAAYGRIAVSHSPADVIAQMLRSASAPLGFSRALYFSVDRESSIRARWQLDGCDVVEPVDDGLDAQAETAIFTALRGPSDICVGRAGELSTPLVDVRRWYVLAPLAHADGVLGLLYVDGHSSREPREWEVNLVGALAAIAAIAIEKALLLARMQELATRDPLTGLLNRRAFDECIAAAIDHSRRASEPLTFVMVDVDDFKRINDTSGHTAGDAVLRRVANTLGRCSRAQDHVGRFAGDEFVVLLVNAGPELAQDLVARLSAELHFANLSCSLGAALYPRDGGDAGSLFHAADRALYIAKAAGKSRFAFASVGPSARETVLRRDPPRQRPGTL